MITHSGVHIQKVGGAEGTPTPLDIAVHSGRICRFGGAIWMPLLPHLIFVGLMAYKRSGKIENLIWGFLHDAHEGVTGEVPRPFKCDCMRKEQKAIDLRLLESWFTPAFQLAIDFDLIHECDRDTCDIEAVELKLPGYVEVTTACADNGENYYRRETHSDESDREMFRRLVQSAFFYETHLANSAGVREFARVLAFAKTGFMDDVLARVEEWDLLR